MVNFNDAVAELLGSLGHDAQPKASIQVIPVQEPESMQDDTFQNFKEFTIAYVEEHDELDENHQIYEQINNLNSVDEIEQMLRSNLDYCDECMLKLFRKFSAGSNNEPDSMCGCGGE